MFLPSNITLKFGDSGDFVAELQRRLAMVHCFSQDQVNGFYDGATVNGVIQFQGMSGLHAAGVAGPETLRRLNGVIAGDTSGSTDNKQEEEEKLLAANQANQLNNALAEQPIAPAMWGEPARVEEAAPAPTTLAYEAPLMQPAAIAAAEYAAFAPDAATMADIAQHQHHQPPQDLGAMLLQQQQPQQPLLTPDQQPHHQRPHELQSQAQGHDPIPVHHAQLQQQPLVQPQPQVDPLAALTQAQPPQPAVAPVASPPEQSQGLLARAGRFANAMMEKLSNYFEAKLPPSVLSEVQSIGLTMASAGLKEAPIPTGPEMAGPAQQLPTRGPEQQPAQVR